MAEKKKSGEYAEKLEIIKLNEKLFEKKHKMKMKELEFARESNRLHHEHEMERQRIKSAEIRKTLYLKETARR